MGSLLTLKTFVNQFPEIATSPGQSEHNHVLQDVRVPCPLCWPPFVRNSGPQISDYEIFFVLTIFFSFPCTGRHWYLRNRLPGWCGFVLVAR